MQNSDVGAGHPQIIMLHLDKQDGALMADARKLKNTSLLICGMILSGKRLMVHHQLGPSPEAATTRMRMARIELAWHKPHAPQACVSTNSTTSAYSEGVQWVASKLCFDLTAWTS